MSGVNASFTASARWLLAGSLVTTIGNALNSLTIAKVLYDKTGSAAAFGGVLIAEQVVAFLLQLIAGPWVDRGHPKRICIQAELIRGVFVCGIALLIVPFAGPGGDSRALYIAILGMTILIRFAQPFYRAAFFSLTPLVVAPERLNHFNSASNIALQIGQLIGLAIAAPLLVYAGAPMAFFINGLTFLVSAVTIIFLRLPQALGDEETLPRKTSRSWMSELAFGWSEVLQLLATRSTLAWHLFLMTIDTVSINLFNLVLMPVIAWRFNGSSYWLSIFDGAFALGAILGAPLAVYFGKRLSDRESAIFGIGLQATGFFILATFANQSVLLLASFLIGAANTVSWTILTTALQTRAPKALRGRIGTVRNILSATVTGVSVPLIANLEHVSVSAMLIASCGLCFGFTCLPVVLGHSRFFGRRLFSDDDGTPASI